MARRLVGNGRRITTLYPSHNTSLAPPFCHVRLFPYPIHYHHVAVPTNLLVQLLRPLPVLLLARRLRQILRHDRTGVGLMVLHFRLRLVVPGVEWMV